MKTIYHVALIPEALPQEILLFLDGYLHSHNGMTFLLCSDVNNLGFFSEMNMFANSDNKKEWKVQLQTQYILAIGEVADSGDSPFGFTSN